jgi:5-methylthioadenosine/S-adenosylhomocysteine deaminase
LDDEIGSIEEGKRADLLILNLDQLHLLPQPDIVSTIVYSAERVDVETVMIDGRLVMQNRHLLTLDEEGIKASVKDQARRLANACDSVL